MSINPRVFEALQQANEDKKAHTGENLTQSEINAICLSVYSEDKRAGRLEDYSPEEVAEYEKMIREKEKILLQTVAQLVADVRAGNIEKYGDPNDKNEVEQLRQIVGQLLAGSKGDLIRQLLEEQDAEKKKSKTAYRTASDARKEGAIAKLPNALAIPTLDNYLYSMSWHEEGKAYLQLFIKTDGLKFKGGKLYFENNEKMDNLQEISEVELQSMKTKEGIESIDLPLLRMFYSIILEQFERTNRKEVKDYVTLYLPDLAECLGQQRNIGQKTVETILAKVQNFHNTVGVLHGTRNGKPVQSYYPVLNFEGYDEKNNTVSFSSPYMNYLIKTIYKNSIRHDKNGNIKVKKNGTPLLLASNTYLAKPELAGEKNKAAAENVAIILQFIERAGDNVPRIKASTIIERNSLLQKRLDESKNKRQLLQRAFSKTWELLRTKSRLTEVYKNIQLPDPKDPAMIPNESNLETLVFSFPHEGKKNTEK